MPASGRRREALAVSLASCSHPALCLLSILSLSLSEGVSAISAIEGIGRVVAPRGSSGLFLPNAPVPPALVVAARSD